MAAPSGDVVPGQWVVLLKPYSSEEGKSAHLHSLRARTEDSTPFSCETHVQFDIPECRGYSAKFDHQTKQEIEQMDGVLSIEPVRYFKHCKWISTDTPCWGLERISQPQKVQGSGPYHYKYRSEAEGQGTVAYIIDTGINKDHVEFEGRAVRGPTFVTQSSSDRPTGDEDLVGHGTHVAGTVGSRAYGVAKKVNIVSIKVFNDTPDPEKSGARTDDIIKALEWVMSDARGKKAVVNMSLGGSLSTFLNKAVAATVRSGVICCVAAGNEESVSAEEQSPSSEPLALTIAAMDKNDKMSWFSSSGRLVDAFGPGTDILSAWKGGKDATQTLSGTSMATPHVAGLVSCMLSDSSLKDQDPFAIISQVTILANKNQLKGLDNSTTNSIVQVAEEIKPE